MIAKPIKHYIEGAPIQIGTKVIVGKPSDITFNLHYKGELGVVAYLEYECGCGQTFPNDPMIGVLFEDGKTEEYWIEELRIEGAL